MRAGAGNADRGNGLYTEVPFEQNWDASLIKHFKIGEHQEARFTADFSNMWNHATFANPRCLIGARYFWSPDPNYPH